MQFLLKFILIAILVIWGLRLLARFLFPWAMKKAAEKIMRDTGHPFSPPPQQSRYQSSHRSDGKIRIDYVPPKGAERKGPQKAGEFIDFEEVDKN